MTEISFVIYGDPVAQGRPRFSRRGNFVRTYDPKPSREYKKYVKMIAQNVKPHQPLSGPLKFTLTIYRKMPKSMTKKNKKAVQLGDLRPTVKPDADNYFKCISDALIGEIYEDDNQLVDVNISKFYSENPRAEVYITDELMKVSGENG